MFDDPLHAISVSLPPGWAFDPTRSSLTSLAFADWMSPDTRQAFVEIATPRASPAASDDEWERVVRAEWLIAPTRASRVRGPVVLAELPAAEGRPACRLAWVRGPRLDVLIRQPGVPPGGALATPELTEALKTLQSPAHRRIDNPATVADWTQQMDASRAAIRAGNAALATRHLATARRLAADSLLRSLIRDPRSPDVYAAALEAESALVLTRLTGSVETLHHATTTLYRCQRSQASARPADPAIARFIEEQIGHALKIHGELAQAAPPMDSVQACWVRSRLFQMQLAVLLDRAAADDAAGSWMERSTLAQLASEDAMTVVAVVSRDAARCFSDLPIAFRHALMEQGVRDAASWKELSRQQVMTTLDTLVSAGHGLSSVQLATLSVSACAMRANALLAARRAVEMAASRQRELALVNIINGYAASLFELGDAPALDQVQCLIAEAHGILDRLGGEDGLRAQIYSNEASLRYRQGRVADGLAAADRATALACAEKQQTTEVKARCNRIRLLSLAGRHDDALAEGRLVLAAAQGPPVEAYVHECLAMAYHHAGHPEAAIAEIRTGLAEALAVNPLGDDVQSLLVDAVRVLQPADSEASLEAAVAAEILFDARRTDIGGEAETIAYDDNADNRDLAAGLVQRQLAASDLLGAFATADRHRARSLVEGTARSVRPDDGVPYRVPPADCALRDQIAFVRATAEAVLRHWGVPKPLAGSDVSDIVIKHGRTVVLFHPTGAQLRIFVVRPQRPVVVYCSTAQASLSQVLELTDQLRQRLGIAVSVRAARGELPAQSISELRPDFADKDSDEQGDLRLDDLRHRLHQALFSEVQTLLENGEPFVVVPYRELSVIPVAVLTGPDGRPLADRHPLSVLPSVSSLRALAEQGSRRPRAVVVGDPLLAPGLGLPALPGAAAEAGAIATMLADAGFDVTHLSGPDATEARFRSAAAGARVIHLACHAALREPASASPLFLARSPNDDGLLLPGEAAELGLDGALVVLSACQSGLGHTTAEGVLGLGRAFMQAGARAIVLSLWRVGDRVTTQLMTELYAGLLGRSDDSGERPLDVAAALSRAQCVTRRQVSDHPTAWGPWQIVGDGAWRHG